MSITIGDVAWHDEIDAEIAILRIGLSVENDAVTKLEIDNVAARVVCSQGRQLGFLVVDYDIHHAVEVGGNITAYIFHDT